MDTIWAALIIQETEGHPNEYNVITTLEEFSSAKEEEIGSKPTGDNEPLLMKYWSNRKKAKRLLEKIARRMIQRIRMIMIR